MNEQFLRQLKSTLFIDIETVAQSANFEDVNERLQKHWERKASFLKNDDKLTAAEMYIDRAAIYAEYGKVICISFGGFYEEDGELKLRVSSFCGDDEKQVLSDFVKIIEKHRAKNNLLLCAHNGKEFDYPYLCRRIVLNGMPLPAILQISGKKPWNIPHLDTLEMWKFGDYKHFTSLDLLAALFDIPSSKQEINGSMVSHTYHVDKDIEKINRYCLADVVVLAQLYLKMNSHDLLPEDKIHVVES
ncbi:MAG: putative PolB exonuclease-like 3'-5' exonuclease [Spirosomataceae bacterium]|jgi:predicted PolB exonuclease-like 3'-5' exonuclease